MATHYGKNLDISIYGGSHDDRIGVYAKGLPEGFRVDLDALSAFMQRRAPGKNVYSTPRKEADEPVFLSGLREDGTLNGELLHAVIYNTNQRSRDYDATSFVPRPSHADFAARMKYGEQVDLRGGGHFSGRLTAPLCIVGGICLQYLATLGITVGAHLYAVGGIYDTPYDGVSLSAEQLRHTANADFPVMDAPSGERMRIIIEGARSLGDSVGGIVECGAVGLPTGLGEHMFDGVESRISALVFGIPAVKGIEFGSGFALASQTGSRSNDAFVTDGISVRTKTNHCGGILGGMTSGMPLIFRVAMKPTPSISRPQESVDLCSMTPVTLSVKGRHDPCVAVRAVPVLEAAAAIAITDLLLDKKEI